MIKVYPFLFRMGYKPWEESDYAKRSLTRTLPTRPPLKICQLFGSPVWTRVSSVTLSTSPLTSLFHLERHNDIDVGFHQSELRRVLHDMISPDYKRRFWSTWTPPRCQTMTSPWRKRRWCRKLNPNNAETTSILLRMTPFRPHSERNVIDARLKLLLLWRRRLIIIPYYAICHISFCFLVLFHP